MNRLATVLAESRLCEMSLQSTVEREGHMTKTFRSFAGDVPRRVLRVCKVVGVGGVLLLACLTSAAQTLSTIQGKITDQQGLVLTSAEIHVANVRLGIDRVTVSGADGSYWVSGLPAGSYVIKVSKGGFTTRTTNAFDVTVNSTVVQNIDLNVGAVAETVNVSTETPLIEGETSSSGTTIRPEQIEQMPINGRNYLDLLQ